MSIEDIFIAIGFIVFCLAIIYYFGQCMSLNTSIIEGLENADKKPDTVTTPAGGLAGNAASTTEAIKAETVKMQDELLIDKYKTDYEAKIIAFDDYINMIMLKMVLDFDPKKGGSGVAVAYMGQLSAMKNGRDALNDVMKSLSKSGGSSSSLGF